MISVFAGRGFQVRFGNGIRVSVMLGQHNYCDRMSYGTLRPSELIEREIKCQNFELAIIDDNHQPHADDGRPSTSGWHNFGGDSVKGYVSGNDLPRLLAWAAVPHRKVTDPCFLDEGWRETNEHAVAADLLEDCGYLEAAAVLRVHAINHSKEEEE